MRAGRAGGGTGGTAAPGPALTFSPWAPFSPCQRKTETGLGQPPVPPTCGHHRGHPAPWHSPWHSPWHLPAARWSRGAPAAPRGPARKRKVRKTWPEQDEGASRVALSLLQGRTYRWPCDAAPRWSRGSRGSFGARRSLQRKDSRNGGHGGHRGLGEPPLPWHLSLLPSLGVPAVRGGPGGQDRGFGCPQSHHSASRGVTGV